MGKRLGAVTLVCAVALVGCTSTVSGRAVRASLPANSDGAVVALMDTGPYPVTPGRVSPVAGSSPGAAEMTETMRMSDYVTGPWRVDTALRARGPLAFFVGRTMPLPALSDVAAVLPDLGGAAADHGFIVGFTTFRVRDSSVSSGMQAFNLQNVVLRFPSPEEAAAAVADVTRKLQSAGWLEPVPSEDLAGTAIFADRSSDTVHAQALTAHGPYLLYQDAKTAPRGSDRYGGARRLISDAVLDQGVELEGFKATDPAKLAELPTDPTGRLLGLTLRAEDASRVPYNQGVWPPGGWLHFEDNPVEAKAVFEDAGVEWVSQWVATVYQTHNREGAAKVVEKFAAAMAGTPDVTPTAGGVPGLPGARCFQRVKDWAPANEILGLRQMAWHFRRIAQADRYAFAAFSETEDDVKQQISAQYRILAGE